MYTFYNSSLLNLKKKTPFCCCVQPSEPHTRYITGIQVLSTIDTPISPKINVSGELLTTDVNHMAAHHCVQPVSLQITCSTKSLSAGVHKISKIYKPPPQPTLRMLTGSNFPIQEPSNTSNTWPYSNLEFCNCCNWILCTSLGKKKCDDSAENITCQLTKFTAQATGHPGFVQRYFRLLW